MSIETREELLTLEEICQYFKVSPNWFYQKTMQTGPGAIPRLKVGRYLRFRLSEVLTFFEEQQNVKKAKLDD